MSEYIVKCYEIEGISGKKILAPEYIDTSSEIVRCRDCKHLDRCQYGWSEKLDEQYCAWGERKEGGE